jgi:hypothetical protein
MSKNALNLYNSRFTEKVVFEGMERQLEKIIVHAKTVGQSALMKN